jgi:tellurite methyltransferase
VDNIERWNERYRAGELGPSVPAPLLVEAIRSLVPGLALDLACGGGRNALYLADRGWDVVAIDGSPVAIASLRKVSTAVDARVLDLERNAVPFPDELFDLVCIINFLHRPLFAEARRMTRHGGCVVSAIHTVKSSMNPKYAIALGELRSYFSDWEILIDREDEVAELAARKPQR